MSIHGVAALSEYDAWRLQDGEDSAAQKEAERASDKASHIDRVLHDAASKVAVHGINLTIPKELAHECDNGREFETCIEPPVAYLAAGEDLEQWCVAMVTLVAQVRIEAAKYRK